MIRQVCFEVTVLLWSSRQLKAPVNCWLWFKNILLEILEISEEIAYHTKVYFLMKNVIWSLWTVLTSERFPMSSDSAGVKTQQDDTRIWDKVFKNRLSKICGRQPLKNLKWYGLPQRSSSNFTFSILEYFGPIYSFV